MVWFIISDTLMPAFEVAPIEVIGYSKDDAINALQVLGGDFIRRGSKFVSDAYFHGFKASQLSVIIDGERFPPVCPNRMDVPLVKVNPLEIGEISIGSGFQSGLGGGIYFRRRTPSLQTLILTNIKLSALSERSLELSGGFEKLNQGVYIRHSVSGTYLNGEGKDFSELYGYKEDVKKQYQTYEFSFMGKYGSIKYNTGVWYYKDVLFPYLLMDERENITFSLSASLSENKMYFNYTKHNMDDSLRKHSMMHTMYMRSEAEGMNLGLVGRFYEVYYRRWNAYSYMGSMERHMIPDVSLLRGVLSFSRDFADLAFNMHLGVEASKRGDESWFSKGIRFFVPFGSRISYKNLSVYALSESPDLKELYIDHPKRKGNYKLKQPINTGISLDFKASLITANIFANYVFNYVRMIGEGNITTYDNTDAFIGGLSLKLTQRYLEISASYDYGQDVKRNIPLAEILPLRANATLYTPSVFNFQGFVRLNYEDAQVRVDTSLNEEPSKSWKTVDLGLKVSLKKITFELTTFNLFNAVYYRHLSYRRDPFSSGVKVYEPGRRIELTVKGGF